MYLKIHFVNGLEFEWILPICCPPPVLQLLLAAFNYVTPCSLALTSLLLGLLGIWRGTAVRAAIPSQPGARSRGE